jgi:acetate---CoA ligase (ADP-forming)
VGDPLEAMLEARTVVLVGASERPGSLGARMVAEVAKSPSRPRTYLVNPRYSKPYLPSIADVPEPADLVLFAVPDRALAEQLAAAAKVSARSAVIFGSASAPGLREELTAIAQGAGLALCGAGCMGFVNVASGLRAIGYVEPDPLPAGPVALVTHSGSVFSTLLRARRGFGFTLAVSSGQELVTTAADYARYALQQPQTRVLALVLEAIRGDLRAVLADAAAADVPVVLLTAGRSQAGRALVAAHSGALAGTDGAWEALATAHGVHRVHDLAELADTLELFAALTTRRQSTPGQAAARHRAPAPGDGIATVHDSGLERAHVADVAADLGVPFATISQVTRDRLAAVLDPGLTPANPLDVWGTGRDTEPLFTECLNALAADPAVAAVALAVDLVPELDGDESYPNAIRAAAAATGKPVAVLAGLPAAIDVPAATALRAAGIPVLEGTRTGLQALRHLLDHQLTHDLAPAHAPAPSPAPPLNEPRQARWTAAIRAGLTAADLFALLRDYGIPATQARPASTRAEAKAAAAEIGYPVVLKTDEPGIAHKSDVGGVRLGLAGPEQLLAAYDDLATRLGPRTLVCETAPPGIELALGITRDPALGPLLIVGAGGTLVELLSQRTVLLPPVTRPAAQAALHNLPVGDLLTGYRGRPPASLDAITDTILALSALATELADVIDALDINPLICPPAPAPPQAADALLLPRHGT